MSEIVETVKLNESNGILYAHFHGYYAAINNPDRRERGETYKVISAKRVGKNYFLTLGEKVEE